ncbi:phosphomannomutase [Octadecabacter temperatus]|uniref:Phosphoglucosamine mutase n=1 Tax=Octadecabacter temperatus TaxID=1458307 RepID=A0A0K0Y8D5_9RHOB|nr:phosphomannomutase [Octadecabacter temperatus]AKS47218.1 Phosphoglucosamine mutase [Octadecabacter temperatus]SIO45174.1 phosphomannomutase [Octadecabacter temperatus]
MAPKFGTSGLRGLVVELTPELVTSYTHAFLEACDTGSAVRIGWDLRPSSPEIAKAVIDAIAAAGGTAIEDGALPTPALALAALSEGQSAIMVTGSHIPADRNGLKFYTPNGEISKDDEVAILATLGVVANGIGKKMNSQGEAIAAYIARYVDGFGTDALRGLRIGIYQHSSVARETMVKVVQALGGEAVPLAWSDTFIPVDTEAVDPETRAQLAGWCKENNLDALISTDGDADRPMVADATGEIVAGDVLGPLTARLLGAEQICTPVSSNTMVDAIPEFSDIVRTRIGSPYVIAAMETGNVTKVVGYEANGGFLLGYTADGPAGSLAPLMTRDCLLPILAPLYMARKAGCGLAELVAGLPSRFTATDRLTGIATDVSGPFLESLCADAVARTAFFTGMPAEKDVDLTDGLRVTFAGGDIVHLRPSGNAPEFRCYAESSSTERAGKLLAMFLEKTKTLLA